MVNFTVAQLREAKKEISALTGGNYNRSQKPANRVWGTSAIIFYSGTRGNYSYTLLIAEYGLYLFKRYNYAAKDSTAKRIKKWVKD